MTGASAHDPIPPTHLHPVELAGIPLNNGELSLQAVFTVEVG